jgi:hypothetical protein
MRQIKKLFRFFLNYGMVQEEDLSMARSLKHERQLLSTDELTLVEKSHHPALGLLPDHDLAELRKLVRERRDRAQTIAARQRRELRGDRRGGLATAEQGSLAPRGQSRQAGFDQQCPARARASPGRWRKHRATLARAHAKGRAQP